ncbi:Trm112 family protein [Hyphomicrobium sp.]|uniref:Trm112 family protein n=1 Tax=Hyphomicrobium sp. TaxID=82 RepID=UPI002B8A92DC|nr:Trm112 family protein [Hyphomicrobium sp.]HRN89408.1 Trm112 family protein [Hyphomicrobium sp.]HRQ25354.1 Trm112 family protein [Hyphomicrobium sp.]
MTDATTKPNAAPDEPDPKLLSLLVCPVTKGPLTYDRAARELISEKANLAYPIRNGVPLMTVEAARSLDTPKDKSSSAD